MKQNVGDVLRLKELGTFHFMMAGPEGAIVDEWACYHDNDGLRFTKDVYKRQLPDCTVLIPVQVK